MSTWKKKDQLLFPALTGDVVLGKPQKHPRSVVSLHRMELMMPHGPERKSINPMLC